MKRYLIRLVLVACAFYSIFPNIPGVQFHGSFLHALGVGMIFAILSWIVESLAIAISAVLTIGTLGMALLFLVPAWLFGFWLLPAVGLRYVADLMPGSLSFTGWGPAIIGGLIMLVIGIATSGKDYERIRKSPQNVD